MCGLAGIVSCQTLDESATRAKLGRAAERLRPRGPDESRLWCDAHLGLAHTRLAVIDLRREAAQPMHNYGLTIVFNGEIYNFSALRSELEQQGYRFRTNGDTEVLIAGWHAWGRDFLPRLQGMFAFAIWDAQSRELVLARDRIGKKPLLYKQNSQNLLFASDLVALDHLDDAPGEIDLTALRLMMTLRFIPEPLSIRVGVRKLLPGHLAVWRNGEFSVMRWDNPTIAAEQRPPNRSAGAAALRQHFDAAVADRLIADVPRGVFLSGGIDSALVAASAVRQIDDVQSFTVGFESASPYFEERPAAREVATYLGTHHTEIAVSATDAISAIDDVFTGLDEPFADSSALPMYVLAREARRHVTVALSGDGADEVFAGYRRYRAELYADSYQRVPRVIRGLTENCLLPLFPESKSTVMGEKVRRLRRFLAHAAKNPSDRQAGFYRLMPEPEVQALCHHPEGGESPEQIIALARNVAKTSDPVNQMLMADQSVVLPGDMLVKVDRMSMANSLEVRSPFLDHRVIALANAMPGQWKLNKSGGKRILIEAFADRLPRVVFDRPKKGFELPIAEWLVGPLQDMARRATDPVRLQQQGLFNPSVVDGWWQALKHRRRDTSELLWGVVAFQAWAERNDITGAARGPAT